MKLLILCLLATVSCQAQNPKCDTIIRSVVLTSNPPQERIDTIITCETIFHRADGAWEPPVLVDTIDDKPIGGVWHMPYPTTTPTLTLTTKPVGRLHLPADSNGKALPILNESNCYQLFPDITASNGISLSGTGIFAIGMAAVDAVSFRVHPNNSDSIIDVVITGDPKQGIIAMYREWQRVNMQLEYTRMMLFYMNRDLKKFREFQRKADKLDLRYRTK